MNNQPTCNKCGSVCTRNEDLTKAPFECPECVDNPERMIINMSEFTETIAPDVRNFALEQFHSAKIENDMIVSNYDEDGYCTFEHIGNNKFEFIGTAK